MDTLDWLKKLGLWFVAFSLVAFVALYSASAEADKKEAAERALWVKASCPVYKSECGSKRKYSCEEKAPSVGRIEVGNIIVEAYATC